MQTKGRQALLAGATPCPRRSARHALSRGQTLEVCTSELGDDVVRVDARSRDRPFQPRDDAAFGGATPVEPKAISPTDPAARYTASSNSVAGYAYSDNYLIDLKHAVIMDVEATTAIRQAEVGAAKTMLDRTAAQFDLTPLRLVADGGYGSAEMVGWLVDERGVERLTPRQDQASRLG